MIANFTNFTGSTNAATSAATSVSDTLNLRLASTRANRPASRLSGRRRDFAAERLAAQERERQIQEAENARIMQLNERIERFGERVHQMREEILELQEDDPIANGYAIRELVDEIGRHENGIASMVSQISQVHVARAEREQLASEQEIARQMQEMEERMRERERIAQEGADYSHKTQEELEKAAERSTIKNMTTMSVRMENIRAHSQTRATLSAAATRLRGEADFDISRQRMANAEIKAFVGASNRQSLEIHKEAVARAIEPGSRFPLPPPWRPMEIGHLFDHKPLAPDGFRGRHLVRLETGVARTEATINRQISALYRDSQNMQEEQLRINREKSGAPSEEDEENANVIENNNPLSADPDEYSPIDLRL